MEREINLENQAFFVEQRPSSEAVVKLSSERLRVYNLFSRTTPINKDYINVFLASWGLVSPNRSIEEIKRLKKTMRKNLNQDLVNVGTHYEPEYVIADLGQEQEVYESFRERRLSKFPLVQLMPQGKPVQSSKLHETMVKLNLNFEFEMERTKRQLVKERQAILPLTSRDYIYMRVDISEAERLQSLLKGLSHNEFNLYMTLSREEPLDTEFLCERVFPGVEYGKAKARLNKTMARLRAKIRQQGENIMNVSTFQEPDYLVVNIGEEEKVKKTYGSLRSPSKKTYEKLFKI